MNENKKELLTKLFRSFSIKELRLAQSVMDEVWYEKHQELTKDWK